MVWRLIIGLVVFYFFLTIIMTKKLITSSILLSTLILSACNSTQKQNGIQQDTYTTPTYKNDSTHSNINSYQIETPTQYPRITVQTDTEPKNCNIKGNISYKNWEKIYHTPDCPYYDETSINTSAWEKRFCSEQEARNAGWRKAYNCN